MENKGTAILLIILGLIILAVPLLGIIPLSLITGFIVLFLGLGLFKWNSNHGRKFRYGNTGNYLGNNCTSSWHRIYL